MNTISVNFNHKNLIFHYRNILREANGIEKNIDLQTIQELYNENVYRVSSELLSGDKVVLDLGSNIGCFAIMAAALGASKVYAVEPNSENVVLIRRNANGNSYEKIIEPIELAIWEEETELTLGDYDRNCQVEVAKLLESEESKQLAEYKNKSDFKVKAKTLVQVMEEYEIGEVDILKVDIEWSEYFIFTHVPEEVMNQFKYITLEFHGTGYEAFGKLIATLTRTHAVETLGSYDRGGFIFARRY